MTTAETEQETQEIRTWVDQFFAESAKQRPNVITALQALQKRFGYLPKTGMWEIARHLEMTPANVYGVATFYNQFRFTPPGRYPIKVCMGTACAIKRADLICDQWERRLGIQVGGVTEDREYSLDRVDCVGCCTLAPVSLVSEEVIGHMAPTKVDGILLKHRIEREQAQLRGDAETENKK